MNFIKDTKTPQLKEKGNKGKKKSKKNLNVRADELKLFFFFP